MQGLIDHYFVMYHEFTIRLLMTSAHSLWNFNFFIQCKVTAGVRSLLRLENKTSIYQVNIVSLSPAFQLANGYCEVLFNEHKTQAFDHVLLFFFAFCFQ